MSVLPPHIYNVKNLVGASVERLASAATASKRRLVAGASCSGR